MTGSLWIADTIAFASKVCDAGGACRRAPHAVLGQVASQFKYTRPMPSSAARKIAPKIRPRRQKSRRGR